MQGIFQKENTDKALKYGIYRHLPTYEKIIRNLVSFYVKKQYGTIPEYLWNDLPDSAILRNDNGKWYAVFMNLEGFKIGLDTKDRVDIMVVKCKPDMISVMTHMKGFLPGYYMDKSNWMTILLRQRIL